MLPLLLGGTSVARIPALARNLSPSPDLPSPQICRVNQHLCETDPGELTGTEVCLLGPHACYRLIGLLCKTLSKGILFSFYMYEPSSACIPGALGGPKDPGAGVRGGCRSRGCWPASPTPLQEQRVGPAAESCLLQSPLHNSLKS